MFFFVRHQFLVVAMLSQKYAFFVELLCCTGLMVPVYSHNSESVGPTWPDIYTSAIKLIPEPLDPCEPYEIEMPDFRKNTPTISEAKCEEYKLHMAYRKIKSDREYRSKRRPLLDIVATTTGPAHRHCFEAKVTMDLCNHFLTNFGIPNQIFLTTSYVGEQASANSEDNYTIIEGRDTLPGEFPHMAAVGWASSTGTWIFKCGGSLISPNYVLTAAHCTRVSYMDRSVTDPVPKIVRLGDKNIADFSNGVRPLDVSIIDTIRNPLYNPPIKYHDIALLKLEHPVDFTKYVQPACLWTYFDTSSLGTEAIVTGWGVTEAHSLTTSPELQAVNLDVVSLWECGELLRHKYSRNWRRVDDATQICAGKLSGGADTCLGDSGGPLQMKIMTVPDQGTLSYVIGVTSFGFGCALPDTPGVYTRVSHYVPWIESVVWPKG